MGLTEKGRTGGHQASHPGGLRPA